MISIKNLSYRFQGSTEFALKEINLEIQPGEFVVVMGPSGCGKSTLAMAIGGYLFSQYEGEAQGSIHVAERDVRQTPVYDIAEVVGLVQQNPEAQFCTLTVQDEIAFGLENRCLPRQEIHDRIKWALAVVDASNLSDRDLSTLSGGEKQKVAIAAMMAAKPQVIILDEPTSNLDPSATAEIFGVIERIRKEEMLTVIVIEHKIQALTAFRPRLIRMAQGSILSDGMLEDQNRTWPAYKLNRGSGLKKNYKVPAIDIRDLCVSYDDRLVLDHISTEIAAGEFVSLMGDNGSGKTTFLLSLMGLRKPDRGVVQIHGKDTRAFPTSKLAREVGFVFQNPDHQLFANSVWEEAVLAPRNFGILTETVQSLAQTWIDRCGLSGREEDHPYRLSYGEKRRLNLISILTYEPKLILLDEILIGQDEENARFILDLLSELVGGGSTVVMVNHSPQITLGYATRLIFLDQGRVLVDGETHVSFQRLEEIGRRQYLPLYGYSPKVEWERSP